MNIEHPTTRPERSPAESNGSNIERRRLSGEAAHRKNHCHSERSLRSEESPISFLRGGGYEQAALVGTVFLCASRSAFLNSVRTSQNRAFAEKMEILRSEDFAQNDTPLLEHTPSTALPPALVLTPGKVRG
jgi:hypothetical protein